MTEQVTPERLEEHFQEELDWPEYYHHYHPGTDMIDSYYRIDGPNGPAYQVNPGGPPTPTTMRSVVLEAAGGKFDRVEKEDTPFANGGNDEH